MLPRPDSLPPRPDDPGPTPEVDRAIHIRAAWAWILVTLAAVAVAVIGRDSMLGILAGLVGLAGAIRTSWHISEADDR